MIRLQTLVLLLSFCGAAYAQDNDSADVQYRLTFGFAHPVDGRLSGNGSVAVEHDTGSDDERSFRLAWPSAIYKQTSWLEWWGGVTDVWSKKEDGATSWQTRPFVGVELSSPKSPRLREINLTRLEWLHTIHGNNDDDQLRLRNRFDLEFPLTSRGWKPGGYYGIAEVEPFVNLTDGFLETVRVGGIAGAILSDRVHLEAECLAEWSRKAADTPFPYSDTLIRGYVKFSFKNGLFERSGHADPGS